jgi:hypothetical protein
VDTSGTLYVADFGNSSIVSVDATTGDRVTASSSTVGSGTDIASPLGFLGTIVDSIVSSGPTVSSATRDDTTPTNASSVDYTVTFSEAVTGVDSTDFTVTTASGDATGSVSSEPTTSDNISYTVTVSSVTGDGTLTLDVNDSGTSIENGSAEALDGGYTSGETYTIDNTAAAVPGTPDLASGSDSGDSSTDDLTNDTTPTITGTSDASVTVSLTSDVDGSVGSTTADGSGDWSITATTLQEGAHSLTATSTDDVGNVSSSSASLSVTVDTTAPADPSAPDLAAGSDTGDSTSDDLTNDTTPTVSGTSDASVTVSLTSDVDGSVGSATADGSGDWSITASTLSEGAQSLTATATDAAGNASSASAALSVTVDTTAPSTTSTPDLAAGSDTGASTTDNNTSATTPTVSGTADASTAIALTSDLDGSVGSVTADGSGDWSVALSTLQEGTHSLTATSTDTAGNASADSSALSVEVDTTSQTVSAVGATTADGTYGVGDAVDVTVALDGAVTVDTSGGTPALVLDMDQTDRSATYSGGTGTTTLTFSYTIQTGDNTTDLAYTSTSAVVLNSGTIQDTAGNDADMTLPTPGATSSLSQTKAIVIETNQTPVADDQSVTVAEDGSVAVTLTSSDGDGDTLTYTVGSATDGTLTGTAPDLTYTPTGDFAGSDSFTFTVNDGIVDSADGTVSITISAVNDAPTLDAVSDVSVDEDNAPADVALTGVDEGGGADEDSQTLTLTATSSDTSVLADPTISGTTLSFATAVADANGSVTVTVTVDDGETSDNTTSQAFTVTVGPVNDTPALVTTGAQSTDEDTPLTVTVTAPDADGDTVTFTAVSDNTDVVVTLANEASTSVDLTMTATADYNGSADITVTADDGTGEDNATAAETFTLTVDAVNDAPVADALSVATSEDVTVNITLTASDVDGDALTYTVASQPSEGTLTGTAPSLTYAPDAQFNGSDSFTFTVNDGTVDSSPATVAIAVAAVNDGPAALHRTVSTTEGVALAITLTGSDGDGDPVSYSITSAPSHGSVTGDAPTVTYTPDADFAGKDVFTYTVSDGTASESAGITILVEGVNSAPVLDPVDDVPIVADGSETSVPLTGVLGGSSSDEAGQTVTIVATSSDTTLLPDPVVAVDDAGIPTLILTAPTGGAGAAVVTLILTDDGETGGAHVNSSTSEFSVTVGKAAIEVGEVTVTPAETREAGSQVTITAVARYGDSATYSVEGVPRATGRSMAANALTDGRTRFVGVFIVDESDPDVTDAVATVTITADGWEPVSVVADGTVTIGTAEVVDPVVTIDSLSVTPDIAMNGVELTIVVVADPSAEVSVDLSALDSTQTDPTPLAEGADASGMYSASVLVGVENAVENGTYGVVARAVDALGNAAELTIEVALGNPPASEATPGATVSLVQGLNLMHVPALIDGVTSAGDLYDFLGGSEAVSAVIAPNTSGRFVAYTQGVGAGSQADFTIASYTGVFVQMRSAKSVVFEGLALPPTVRLHRGINQIGIPRDGAIARFGDLYELSAAVQRIVRYDGGRFIAIVSDDTDATVAAGDAVIVVTNDDVELTLDGDPWLSTAVVAAAPGIAASRGGDAGSLMVAMGRVLDIDGGAPLDGLLARIVDVSAGAQIEDTVGATAGAGQFQAAFFDPTRAFRVGDTIEVSLSDPTGMYRDIAPLRRTVTATDLRNGTLAFGDIALSRVPVRTSLLPNYPNPSNPETWIPFELSERSDVTVTIYDVQGSVVRRLELGSRAAGTHRTTARAAHWDGRNDEGETVGSGVYFAKMKAGDTRRTQRLVIMK